MWTAPQAIFATQIENAKNIQSYSFRKRWIKTLFDVDLDVTDVDRAVAAYVYWYRVIAPRAPVAWICLERATNDLERLFGGGLVTKREDADGASLAQVINTRKLYHQQVYSLTGDVASALASCNSFVRKQYLQLKSDLYPALSGLR